MLLYSYISRFSVNPHYQQQLYLRPSFIPIFNFSHKRPSFAFTGESGYTLGPAQRIAHKGTHGETGGVLGGGWYHYSRSVPHVHQRPRAGYQNGKLCRFWALVGGALEEYRKPSGQRCAYARRCPEASRPRWAAQLYLFIGVFTFVKDFAGCCQYSSPITKGAADSNIRIGTLSGHDQNTTRRSKIQKLNAMRQHIRVLQCMALRLSG